MTQPYFNENSFAIDSYLHQIYRLVRQNEDYNYTNITSDN